MNPTLHVFPLLKKRQNKDSNNSKIKQTYTLRFTYIKTSVLTRPFLRFLSVTSLLFNYHYLYVLARSSLFQTLVSSPPLIPILESVGQDSLSSLRSQICVSTTFHPSVPPPSYTFKKVYRRYKSYFIPCSK